MSASLQPNLDAGGVIVPLTGGEPVPRHPQREISILLLREEITITHARYWACQQVAGPHIHHHHTDAFCVLEGELTFQIGREANTITVRASGFLAAPPRVAHSFANNSDRLARWLTIHAHDGGFAAFMRGVRDGVEVEWDISAVPPTAACPPATRPSATTSATTAKNQRYRLRRALPDPRIGDWHVRAMHPLDLPPPHQHSRPTRSSYSMGPLKRRSPARHRPSTQSRSSRCPTPCSTRFTNTGPDQYGS